MDTITRKLQKNNFVEWNNVNIFKIAKNKYYHCTRYKFNESNSFGYIWIYFSFTKEICQYLPPPTIKTHEHSLKATRIEILKGH